MYKLARPDSFLIDLYDQNNNVVYFRFSINPSGSSMFRVEKTPQNKLIATSERISLINFCLYHIRDSQYPKKHIYTDYQSDEKFYVDLTKLLRLLRSTCTN